LDDDLESNSLPRADVSARILIVTDITQDANTLQVLEGDFDFVGDTGTEFG
jgi:hypothetical protein